MARIRQLSAGVVNKIAAGEVIERPASVVKELLENSVDALATRIDVDIVEGGSELIRVVDDGEGIHPDDLLLAVSSHATSKIAQADDLFHVQTLGFRGEALASIAEISEFSLRTRQADRVEGTELVVHGGEIVPPRACGCAVGTTIEVAQLFLNTPVRRKFLKAVSTEFGHIAEQFTRVALANPRLHMVLRHNRKPVWELPATERLLDRIRLFFGQELADQLVWVESEQAGVRMWGYVGHPSVSKSTRKGQYLFLNGRWIQDRSLQHALGEAYRGLLMVGRNPVSFLFLEMPADLVDVNVHPTKSEVRFRESQSLYRQLLSTIRTQFSSMNLDSSLHVSASSKGTGSLAAALRPVARQADPARQQALQAELVHWAKGVTQQWAQSPQWREHPEAVSQPSAAWVRGETGVEEPPVDMGDDFPFAIGPEASQAATSPAYSVARSQTADSGTSELLHWPRDESTSSTGSQLAVGIETGAVAIPAMDPTSPTISSPNANPDASSSASPSASVHPGSGVASPGVAVSPVVAGDVRAMQIHDCYLVVETEEGMTVVDQHALHERIMYEHLRERVLSGGVESQRLLLPETVELSASEAALLLEQAEVLAQCGLHVQEFGGTTILVTAYPVMLRRTDPAHIVREVAEHIVSLGQAPSRRDLLDSLLHMMSCKAAIKAGQRLTPEEIEALLRQRHLIHDAHHCPHGRPTALVLSMAELDRQFGRLG